MRIAVLASAVVSIVSGVLQLIFVMWAGEASLHLGSPIRGHGGIADLFAGHPRQSLIKGQYQAALQVIDTLEVSLYVHMAGGALLILLGAVLGLVYLRPTAFGPRR